MATGNAMLILSYSGHRRQNLVVSSQLFSRAMFVQWFVLNKVSAENAHQDSLRVFQVIYCELTVSLMPHYSIAILGLFSSIQAMCYICFTFSFLSSSLHFYYFCRLQKANRWISARCFASFDYKSVLSFFSPFVCFDIFCNTKPAS